LNLDRRFSFKINKWLNSKRSDGIPLIEIQVRKPMKCKMIMYLNKILSFITVKRNLKQRHSLPPQSISNTTISSIHEYGKII
jgi:hypothetical protein